MTSPPPPTPTGPHPQSGPPPATPPHAAAAGWGRRRRPLSRAAATLLTYLLLLAGAALMLLPFAFSAMTALKTPRQFATTPPLTLPDPVTLENFAVLFTEREFWIPIVVTAQVVIVMVVGQLVSSVLAAYAFATLQFPGRDLLFWVYLSTLMIPAVVTLIPLYVMVTEVGLKNTFWGLVLPLVFGSPYAIFLLRENFRSVPGELLDAARLDGAGTLARLWHVVLPLNTPIIATLTLITVVTHWNNFMWPSIIAPAPEWRVVTVATAALQSQYSGNWTLVMAATTIALAPLVILFLIFQDQITRSIGVTGVR